MSQLGSKNKVAEICSILRKETIEPAQQEAREIVENAQLEKEKILKKAAEESQKRLAALEKELAAKQETFTASIQLAFTAAIDRLQEAIEKKLFKQGIKDLFGKELEDPNILASIIEGLVDGAKKEGFSGDFSTFITKHVPKEKILQAVHENIRKRLEKKPEELTDLSGLKGVEVSFANENFRVQMTEDSIKSLLAASLRKDFRDMLFTKHS